MPKLFDFLWWFRQTVTPIIAKLYYRRCNALTRSKHCSLTTVFYHLKGWYWSTIALQLLYNHLSSGGVLSNRCTRAMHFVWLHSTLQDGLTALHVASFKGHHKVVELLLGAWANPNLRDKVKTVLWYSYN